MNFKAFTLVEVLIVIAIISVIAGVSWSTFKVLQPSLQLASIARDLTTDLRYAQQLAVTEQVNHGVRFSTTADEYQIIRYGTTTEEILRKSLPENVDFQEIVGFSNNEVIFNPYGAVKTAGTVCLINTKNTTTTIEIKPSGFVKIK